MIDDDDLIDDLDIIENKENYSILEFIKWWEWKRLRYNLFLFLAGILGLLLGGGILVLFRYHLEDLILGSFIYAILANICYTAGWVIPLLLRSWNFNLFNFAEYRKSIFWLGIIISILLTLFMGIGASAFSSDPVF